MGAEARPREDGRRSLDVQQRRSGEEQARSRSFTADRPDLRASILDRSSSQYYAYGAAEAAAMNMGEPWRVAAALGRDALTRGQSAMEVGFQRRRPGPPQGEFLHETHSTLKQREKEAEQGQSQDLQAQAETTSPAASEDMKGLQVANLGGSQSQPPGNAAQSNEGQQSGVPNPKLADSHLHDKLSTQISGASSLSIGDIGAGTGSGGHYDPSNDAILRLETMTPGEARILNLMLWSWLTVALGFLIFEFVQKLIDGRVIFKNFNTLIINSVVGGACFLLMTLTLIHHTWRIIAVNLSGKIWKPKRRKVLIYTTIEIIAQEINLLFFLLINWENFGPRCFRIKSTAHVSYYALVRWTCWNTIFLLSLIHAHNSNPLTAEDSYLLPTSQSALKQRSDLAVSDLPFLQAHGWKLILWTLMECSVIAACVYYAQTAESQTSANRVSESAVCGQESASCRGDNTALGLVAIMVFFALLYFTLYIFYVFRALDRLRKRPRSEFKMNNIIVRLQMRLRLPAFAFFTLSMLLLWYVRLFACTSLIYTWFGMLPGQVAATIAVLLMAFCCQPTSSRSQQPILQVWLQEFAWVEAERAEKVAKRNSSLPPEQRAEIAKEPMFCVETMMTSLYWSLLAYDYQEVEDSKLSLEEGCSLFNPPLENYELFWEKSLDTKMLLAWNSQLILLAFRGTASMSNVKADIMAWRATHKPLRGPFWNRPKVHNGFQLAWRNNSLHDRVMKRITELIKSGGIDTSKLKFHVTGHSLGGALATLAAYDVRAYGLSLGKDPLVTCITFGAPRTGNHAFAREFERMVPDCWHIINDQDLVARGGKFLVLYKRGGQRVLINERGDMVVRPNAIEASLHLVPCSGSVQQHLLTSYLKSLLAVLVVQFSGKSIKGGTGGVVRLAEECKPIQKLLLEEVGLEFADLVHMARWGASSEQVAKVAEATLTGRKLKPQAKALAQGEQAGNARGGLLFSCCRPLPGNATDARGGEEVSKTAAKAET